MTQTIAKPKAAKEKSAKSRSDKPASAKPAPDTKKSGKKGSTKKLVAKNTTLKNTSAEKALAQKAPANKIPSQKIPAQKIIDMRSRPAYLHDFFGATPGTASFETAKWLNQRVGSQDVNHFQRSYTLPGYLEEIEQAGVSKAVVVGRETPGLTIDNDKIAELVKQSPLLVGLGSVDIQSRGEKDAIAEINRAVNILGFRAINIEPGFGEPALQADDPLFYPVYEECIYHDVPVCLMSGPTTPDFDYAHPSAVARLARRYPLLKIICFHGYYPFVNEIVGAAFRYDNIYLVPDMYIFQPGSQLYVEAANGFLADQLLFGSSYPFRAMRQSVEDFAALGFKESVLDKVFYQNAERLLKITA